MFDGYIRDFAFWTPDAPAVLTPERIVSYAEFDADVDRIGWALEDMGLRPGVGVASIRIAEPYLHRLVLAALSRLGVASSPAEDEAAEVKVIYREAEVLRPPPPGFVRLTPEWMTDALDQPHRPLPRRDPDPEALVRVMLSSGTTRRPKRIGFTWRRLELATLTNVRIYGPGRLGVWVPLSGADSLLGFSLGVAAWAVGAAFAAGVTVRMMPQLMQAMPQGLAVMTPRQLQFLLDGLPEDFAPCPGWRLQVGGSAIPAGQGRAAMERITPDIWTGYGATESSRITAGPLSALIDVGSVGVVPAAATVEIVDETGRVLPDGEAGELRVRSTRTAEGYLGDPEQTAARFRDGWYYTNDLARRLDDGRIVIEGRLDDRMNLGGRKLMPIVIERPALAFPGVVDCAAFAVPGPSGMDQAWLAIVAEADLHEPGLEGHLSRLGLPRVALLRVDEIPRNEMGKVDRVRLRELAGG